VCSHGHDDHTAGLDGLIRRLGREELEGIEVGEPPSGDPAS